MASKFKKGEEVRVNTVVPQGVIQSIRMDDDGEVYYLFSWIDASGNSQLRWFAEKELQAI
jgi:uncharacterized protein YodC (DUF2158 family)